MPPVFAHGALRLYLLALLESGPKHGYELIKALSERFGGTYSPSAGTIYPRLGKLEEEGLVATHTEGRRTNYSITPAGLAGAEQPAGRTRRRRERHLGLGPPARRQPAPGHPRQHARPPGRPGGNGGGGADLGPRAAGGDGAGGAAARGTRRRANGG